MHLVAVGAGNVIADVLAALPVAASAARVALQAVVALVLGAGLARSGKQQVRFVLGALDVVDAWSVTGLASGCTFIALDAVPGLVKAENRLGLGLVMALGTDLVAFQCSVPGQHAVGGPRGSKTGEAGYKRR